MPTVHSKPRYWLVTSPEYVVFVGICEKNQWQRREFLPRKGEKIGKDLDAFMLKGLNGKEFTRTQVNAKFAHWKASFESEKEATSVDPVNILSTTELLIRFRETFVYLIAAETNVVFLDESLPTHTDIVDSEECDTLFDAGTQVRTMASASTLGIASDDSQ